MHTDLPHLPEDSIANRWRVLNNRKDTARLEKYAAWTIPSIFAPAGSKERELSNSVNSTGAEAVNHLSNKLVLTLFRPNQPFFRLRVRNDTLNELKTLADSGDSEAATILKGVDKTLLDKEMEALQELDYNKYRTEATTTAKHLIITGNALLYHPTGGKVQVYGLRDFCVVRDLSGTVIEFLTQDNKSFKTFGKAVQDALRASDKKYDAGDEDVTLYTRVVLNSTTKKYDVTQAADVTDLEPAGSFSAEDLPWIPLTWNLARGEDYGRGLVEDYAGAFHGLNILSSAEVDIAAIAADIKWLVKPASVLDVNEMNRSKSGSYHMGELEDVGAIQLDKLSDMQLVELAIDRYTKQISRAFLLNTSVTREAERVTAEEIRFMAQELELAHGGIYSRFAEEWQLPTARLILRRVGLGIGKGREIYPQIITGLESLSRAGDMENLHMLLADLAALNNVPEEFRAVIDPSSYIAFCGTRRGVDYAMILKSEDQIAQEQEAAAQQEQALIAQQTQANVAEEAGKQAVQQET